MFRASSRPSSGAQQLQQQRLVLPSERGDSSAVGRGRTGWPATSWLMYLNCMMMHGLANFKWKNISIKGIKKPQNW